MRKHAVFVKEPALVHSGQPISDLVAVAKVNFCSSFQPLDNRCLP